MDLHDELVTALAGRYEIERELGRGGMAIVYVARDVKNHRKVALKVMRPELSDALGTDRFLREIAIAAPLVHPNIMALHDSGEAGGFLYYTMPFVEGPTLRQRLERERQLPLDEALSIARQAASALDYAHARGTVHRDIKPENVLLLGEHVLVADFGLARAITQAASRPLTSQGIVVGTPAYMSPEQCSPGETVTAASDTYSLACVVYEMIAGVPPFRAPTADVMMSHHQVSTPPSVCEQRRSCPAALDLVVRRALAKAPADRYRSAGEFVKAMQRAVEGVAGVPSAPSSLTARSAHESSRVRSVRRLLTYIGVLAVLVAVVAIVVRYNSSIGSRSIALDPSRILVFPLRDDRGGSAVGGDASGEAIATYIGYALEETRPLKWLEAWDFAEDEKTDLSNVGKVGSRRIAQRAGAGHYIDGTILRGPDSVTVVLRLHSVLGDSLVRVTGASGASSAYLPTLGLRAVSTLLPAILQPGRTLDLRSLSDRKPSAIANFLQGEREYRRMQFAAALEHYESAVRDDSAFAIAALKGAQTANWRSRAATATALVDVSLRRTQNLTAAQSFLASGLHAYLAGDADSAAAQLRASIRADSTVPEAWTLLGEVYVRSLTSDAPADSLARLSLQRGLALDPDFAPALLLLEEIALREGKLADVERLREELRRAGADTTHATERDVTWRCVSKGARSVRWEEVARRDAASTLNAGRILLRGASHPACARSALMAVFRDDSASFALRRGALVGLNGLLLATGHEEELRALFASKSAEGMALWQFYLLNAAAGMGFEREAAIATDSLGRSYSRMTPPTLWMIGSWAGRAGDGIQLREIARALQAKADSSQARRDLLLARLIGARLKLVEGDTSAAIAGLRAARPNGPRRETGWQPWEGLGLERLVLAELLFTRGETLEAMQVASRLDATDPVPYLLYLKPSLALRVRIAEQAGKQAAAANYSSRMKRMAQ